MSNYHEVLKIWIPRDLAPHSRTMDIANTLQSEFHALRINNDEYNNNFEEYYNQHIRQNEDISNTFCYKDGLGINTSYLIENANKHQYITLLSLDVNIHSDADFKVNAIMVCKWSATANAAKIQAFCGNKKIPKKGAATKLMNTLKKTLEFMNINDIYLNPIPSAVSYYQKQEFRNTTNPGKKVYDSSSPKPKSGSKSKIKSKKPSSVKQSSFKLPTMTINLRARRNWKKTKTKLKSIHALTHKKHGKSHIEPPSKKIQVLLKKINKIVNSLPRDHREIAECRDIYELLEQNGVRMDELSSDDDDLVRDYLIEEFQIY